MIDVSLPFIDLHRHLDGSVRLETILDLARKHNLPLPARDVDTLRPLVQVTHTVEGGAALPGVMAFIAKFKWMTAILVNGEACRRVAYEGVQDARREGLDYVELRFSPWFMAQAHGLRAEEVVEAVVDGAEAGARDFGIKVGLIGILSRTYGPETSWQELEALLRAREHFVALDLAGDEAAQPGELFVGHFQRAREAGWQVTVHAGEAAGPESVWQALRELGASRIGHAVAAARDASLMDFMASRGIAVETSLTSNVQTSTVAGYASHPARLFLEHGMRVTLNTDDPGISAIDLRHEYEVAAPAAGLTKEQIHQAQRNALEAAFLSHEEKMSLAARAARRESRPGGEGTRA